MLQKVNDDASSIKERVLGLINEEAWLDLARQLIPAGQPEAENPLDPDEPPAREEGAAVVVAAILREIGLSVELVAKRTNRPNVIGSLAGSTGGHTLILNDHLDTYPAGDWAAWTLTGGHPFRPTRHGDWLYARGTSDTRGNLACTLLAARAIVESGVKLNGDLKCVYTVDEERDGPDGSIFLLDEFGLKADAVIVCEPTGWTKPNGDWGMGIALANGGHLLVEIETRGIKTHLWRPDTGVNAIAKMGRLIGALEAMTFTHNSAALAGGTPPLVTVLRIDGGLKREMQFTPDVCRLVIAVVGIVPGMTAQTVMHDIETLLASHRMSDPTLQATARPYPGALFVPGTLEQSEGACPSLQLSQAYKAVLGEAPTIYRKNAFNDTIRFAERGIAAITFGPGEDGWTPINESIHIPKAVAATKILALTVLDILGCEA